jgi:expansin
VTARSGKATHYALQSGGGNCLYPGPPADGLFVALGPAEYRAGAACGSYLEVTGPGGTVRVKVIDQCPECSAGHLDLSERAFARLAPLGRGEIPVTYRQVANPPMPPLSFRIKEGSSPYWLAILAIDHGNPLTSVEVRVGSGWRALVREDYNYWLAESGLGAGPFTLRLTDSQGHSAVVRGIKLAPGRVQSTRVRMYGPGDATRTQPREKPNRSFTRIPAPPWPEPTTSPGTASPTRLAIQQAAGRC